MKIKPIGHLVKVGKTKPNKAKVKIGKMYITSFITMNYEQITMNDEKNKAKQTQSNPIPLLPKTPKLALLNTQNPRPAQNQMNFLALFISQPKPRKSHQIASNRPKTDNI